MALEEEAMLRLRIIAAAAMWLCSVGIAAAAPAPPDTFAIQGGVIDRVVATVEDRAILKSDIDAELARILMQTKRTEVPREQEQSIREEILQGLIGEALLVIQAERENITVEDRDVDQRVEQIIEENKTTLGGDEAFNRQASRSKRSRASTGKRCARGCSSSASTRRSGPTCGSRSAMCANTITNTWRSSRSARRQ
jgi:hypothetical protein